MITCKQAEKMVMPYIDYELDEEQLEQFLYHIQHCPECKEELEIYYTVFLGLRQLDAGVGKYDFAATMEESLDEAWLKIHTVHLRKTICYAVNTLSVVAILTVLLLQLRIWMQMGILG